MVYFLYMFFILFNSWIWGLPVADTKKASILTESTHFPPNPRGRQLQTFAELIDPGVKWAAVERVAAFHCASWLIEPLQWLFYNPYIEFG